jgi:outer membrane protein OmpA-like peptidoglycan-associated protein
VRGTSGATGEIGAQGVIGEVDCWTSYRDFWFASESARIQDSDLDQVAEIATYMKDHPSVQLGIDGSLDPRNSNGRDRELSNRRVETIRTALIDAGVPAGRITAGAYGDEDLRRDRRVEVLLVSAG